MSAEVERTYTFKLGQRATTGVEVRVVVHAPSVDQALHRLRDELRSQNEREGEMDPVGEHVSHIRVYFSPGSVSLADLQETDNKALPEGAEEE